MVLRISATSNRSIQSVRHCSSNWDNDRFSATIVDLELELELELEEELELELELEFKDRKSASPIIRARV